MRGTEQSPHLLIQAVSHCRLFRAVITASLLGLVGCGQSSAPPVEQAELEWEPTPVQLERTPSPSGAKGEFSDGKVVLASSETMENRPEKGSAEWLLMEIARLRNLPVDQVRESVPGRPGEFVDRTLSEEEARQERLSRHRKTVELAMQTISKTHQDESATELFNSAVHFLVDARTQLALAGDHDQVRILDENAEALFQRDPTSFAAVDAGAHLVELAHQLAQRHAESDPQWALAFARQARLFAERFPQETSKAAVNLIAAGKMCERLKLDDEAETCLAVVEQIAPGSPYAEQVEGSLRRLRLPGQQLTQFGGSTFDGEFTSIERYRGTPLIIAFWASNSEEFRQTLPTIQSLVDESRGKLKVVGVNMDRDERAVERFLLETGIDWKQIFYSDPEKRGLMNVVARHYGVTRVPEYWLVDADGVVRSIHLDPMNLKEEIELALTP